MNKVPTLKEVNHNPKDCCQCVPFLEEQIKADQSLKRELVEALRYELAYMHDDDHKTRVQSLITRAEAQDAY